MTHRRRTPNSIRRLSVSMAAPLLLACSLHAGDQCADLRTIASDVDGRSPAPIIAEALDLATFGLPTLGLKACAVTVLGSVPPYTLVYLQHPGGAWALSINDGNPAGHADQYVLEALNGTAPTTSALELAREITRALIDPDLSTAVVLESRASIPVDREASDVLRDLKAQGLDPGAIVAFLLEGAPSDIQPPRFQLDTGGQRVLVFYVWRYFGGGVLRIRVPMESTEDTQIHIDAVATQVGSWDLRM